MPRKAKDEEVIKNTARKKSTVAKSSTTVKKTSASKKVSATKKSASNNRTSNTVKKTASNKKNTTAKKSTATKKSTSAEKVVTSKEDIIGKKSSTKKTSKKGTSKKGTSKKVAVPIEYYDLPNVYDKTVVKILAQTPSCLFVYWEISEKDKLKLQEQYGEGFFQNTKPYLVIINETMNYSFETEINDYANSWYIHIHDSDCKYSIRLIRKPINHEVPISSPSIHIMSSNEMDTPNDHILFDKLGKTVFFKNVQNNIITQKDISSLSFISNVGRIYNIYDLYKEIYKDELDGNEFGMRLSSSQFSSFFK